MMKSERGRTGRLMVAVLVTVAVSIGSAAVSLARPSHQDLVAARAKLDALNARLDVLVEQYDAAKVRLQRTEGQLADARAAAQRAQAQSAAARSALAARARAAYESSASSLEILLSATSFAEFSDRLQFLDNASRADAALAQKAEVKGREARRAAATLAAAVTRHQDLVAALASRKQVIQSSIAQATTLISQLEKALAKPVFPKPKKVVPTPVQPGGSGGGSGRGGGGPGPGPGAAQAVAAAHSVIGVPYVWGGSDPNVGFDCSGLTMWSWAQAGVSLPHSSAMQYAILPHVARSDLKPGDLVFFYSPIHHVGIYVGNGMMIHAPHTGAYVELVPLASEPDYVGAGRPG